MRKSTVKVLQQNSQYNYFVLRFPILLLDLLLSNGSNLQQKKKIKKKIKKHVVILCMHIHEVQYGFQKSFLIHFKPFGKVSATLHLMFTFINISSIHTILVIITPFGFLQLPDYPLIIFALFSSSKRYILLTVSPFFIALH